MASLKILLMHPEGPLGKGIQEFLESQGHAVNWVRDEEGCRQLLDQEIFDGLILEVKPEGDQTVDLGRESAESARRRTGAATGARAGTEIESAGAG